MSTSTLKNLPKGTVEIVIIIPWSDIKGSYEAIFADVLKNAEIAGFRKGKAPKKLVEDKIDKATIYEEVVKKIVPPAYSEAIRTHQLKPIISPKVEVLEAHEAKDWKIRATVALKPKIDLKSYKDKIRELKKSKATLPAGRQGKIWVPGQGDAKEPEESKKPTLDEIISALVDAVEIEISDLMIQDEANRLLAGLIDQTKKLGITVEQYLSAKGKTTEQLRAEYATEAKRNLTVELTLAEIADKENITVSQQDIDQLINKVESAEEKARLKDQSYYLAHLIRQQKTLDFLGSL